MHFSDMLINSPYCYTYVIRSVEAVEKVGIFKESIDLLCH